MDAVIYTRVSNLAGSTSTQDQEHECRAVCDRNGWNIRAVFCDDGISASRYGGERPAWAALKSELRHGDVLVVWEASRAHRDLAEYVALRNLCASLDVPLSYSGRVLDLSRGDDRFMGGLDALVAERESEQTKVRVLRGKRAAATAGRPSTRPPWGYRLARPGEWEFDPVEAPRVRQAVTKLLGGETMYSVMRWIEDSEGYTPANLTNLRRALTNPALAGLRVHQGEVVGDGNWQSIITADQHKALVRELKRRKRTGSYETRPSPEPKYLLSGIALCGKCSEGLRRKHQKGRPAPSYVCYQGHCSRPVADMDAAVEREVFRWAPRIEELYYKLGGDPVDDAAADKIEELETTLQQWTEAAISGEISPASFAKIEKGIRAQIDALEPRVTPAAPPVELRGREIETGWGSLSMRQKRDFLRFFFNITLFPAERRGGTGRLVIVLGGESGIRPVA